MRKLQRRRARLEVGAFVVEGEDLVLAGITCGAVVRALLVDAERGEGLELPPVPAPVLRVVPELLADVSELGHAPRVIGIFELPAPAAVADIGAGAAPWIALDGVADPGNVGTVLRTVAALGAGGVVLLPGTADPFGGKAVRASMGAVFRVPMLRQNDLAGVRGDIVALDAGGDVALWNADLDGAAVLVIGAERAGVSDSSRAAADRIVTIPQDPDVESLNAGVAAALTLYEWRSRADR